MAQITDTSIIPLVWATNKFKLINSWDSFVIPYPFSKGVYSFGKPINVKKKINEEELEFVRHKLENEIKRLTLRVEIRVN